MVRSFTANVDGNFRRQDLSERVRAAGPVNSRARSNDAKGNSEVIQKPMTIYVVEIDGRGIAAFSSDTASQADARLRDPAFRDDLMVLATNRKPLWNGVTAIYVRTALPSEDAIWRASHAKAIRQGSIEEDDDEWVAFLVTLTDTDRQKRC